MSTVDDIWAEVEAMEGATALPRPGDAPMFAETWHGRLVAMAVETVHKRGLDWDAFRVHLIAALDADPERAYYDSFLVAMEAFTTDQGLVEPAAVEAERHVAASYRTTEIDHDDLEVFPVEVSEQRVLAILGVLADRLPGGTADIGALVGDCAHAEFQRLWIDGAPRSWMFRMFNGDGEQQITVLLPNPFLDDDMQPYPEPHWDRLRWWDDLRARHLGLGPDPADRLGTEFVHG